MSAKRVAGTALFAMLMLIIAWRGWLAPPVSIPSLWATLLHALPVLPALLMLILRHGKWSYWAAVGALPLFCHGITELWTTPGVRALAAVETLLSLIMIFASSWDGLRARLARRRTPA